VKVLLLISLFIFTSCSLFEPSNEICVLKALTFESEIHALVWHYTCFEDNFTQEECVELIIGKSIDPDKREYTYLSYGQESTCAEFCQGKPNCERN
jgi:hypothetical protein